MSLRIPYRIVRIAEDASKETGRDFRECLEEILHTLFGDALVEANNLGHHTGTV